MPLSVGHNVAAADDAHKPSIIDNREMPDALLGHDGLTLLLFILRATTTHGAVITSPTVVLDGIPLIRDDARE